MKNYDFENYGFENYGNFQTQKKNLHPKISFKIYSQIFGSVSSVQNAIRGKILYIATGDISRKINISRL